MSAAAPTPVAVPVDGLLRVEEVSDAEFYVGDLFRRQFGGAAPDYPRHFVAWYRAGRNVYAVVGYLHCTIIDELCLCGGLVEDERALARMPAPHQSALRTGGGIAARLFRDVFRRLDDKPAFFAYVGDTRIRGMFERAGFAALASPYLMVRWNAVLTPSVEQALVARVSALGAF